METEYLSPQQKLLLQGSPEKVFLDELVEKFREAQTPRVLASDKVSEAGRKILGFQFVRMLLNESESRLGEDIEALHDMRVATRRMRVAFEVFGPFYKKKSIGSHLKGLQNTGRTLGRVRDLDVFLIKLNTYLQKLPEHEHPEFELLISYFGKKHTKVQKRMIKYLDSDQYILFIQQYGRFLNTPGEGEKPNKHLEPQNIRYLAPIMIFERFAKVRTFEQRIENASIEELHALRLELKKLRYVIEFFRDILGQESIEVIQKIKILQDHLGNLNDADVACQKVTKYISKSVNGRVSFSTQNQLVPKSIMTYLETKRDDRNRLISTFPQTWNMIINIEFNRILAKAVSAL